MSRKSKDGISPELRKWAKKWKLDDYELEIEKAFEKGNVKTSPNQAKLKREAEAAARNYFRKNARLNLRLNDHDLLLLKQRAAVEGLPYQTLAASIIHKFVHKTPPAES